ncbi:hypothetical protein WG66_014177 [Moniliophthora roreri]|uniref:DUF6534 domain-containing protein n=1 Tax=Moniliophthora roreri TaxID=221103 RepID=A0A0W0G048_MONRR|nr:hypothetical protein WG66_014177 [Moniliophthora roreri]
MALPLANFFVQVAVEEPAMSTEAPKLNLDNTMGAAFVGLAVAGTLYGISVLQTFRYFTNPGQDDGWPIKTLVGAVLFFDTVHHILISHTMYTYLVTNYNNPAILVECVWSLLAEVLFNGFTALLVQSFLTLRVWKYLRLTRPHESMSAANWFVTAVAVVLVLAEFGCITAFGIMALVRVKTFADLATMKWLSILVNALAAAGDVYIAATLCWLLQNSRTGFRRSDTIIKKLILFTVNTGALTSLCAITAAPNTFIYITFFFCIGRLYANSLLATLNARKYIRESADQAEYNTTTGAFRNVGTGSANVGTRGAKGISIQIKTTQEYITDASPAKGKNSRGSIGDDMEMTRVQHSDNSDSEDTLAKTSHEIV